MKGASIGGPIEIISADPEVMALQAMLKGLEHFNSKEELSMQHLMVLMAVELFIKVTKGRAYPKVEEIGRLLRLKPEHFADDMAYLIEKSYLHEIVPQYGELVLRYKPGCVGGTVLRKMLSRPAKKKKEVFLDQARA